MRPLRLRELPAARPGASTGVADARGPRRLRAGELLESFEGRHRKLQRRQDHQVVTGHERLQLADRTFELSPYALVHGTRRLALGEDALPGQPAQAGVAAREPGVVRA